MCTQAHAQTHTHTRGLTPPPSPAHPGRAAGRSPGSRGCAGRTPLSPWLSRAHAVPGELTPPPHTHTAAGLGGAGAVLREPPNSPGGGGGGGRSPMPARGHPSAPTSSRVGAGGEAAPGGMLRSPPSLGNSSPFATQGLFLKAGVAPCQTLPSHPSYTPKKLSPDLCLHHTPTTVGWQCPHLGFAAQPGLALGLLLLSRACFGLFWGFSFIVWVFFKLPFPLQIPGRLSPAMTRLSYSHARFANARGLQPHSSPRTMVLQGASPSPAHNLPQAGLCARQGALFSSEVRPGSSQTRWLCLLPLAGKQ